MKHLKQMKNTMNQNLTKNIKDQMFCNKYQNLGEI